MSVYFLHSPTTSMVKIGYTSASVDRRVRLIQGSSPVPLELLGIVDPAQRALERALHRHFADARGAGEWFAESPELLRVARGQDADVIRRLMAVPDGDADHPGDPAVTGVGAAFRRVRREREISQEAVAAKGGVHVHQVSRLELGSSDVRLSTFLKAVDGLGVPLSEIVRRYEERRGE